MAIDTMRKRMAALNFGGLPFNLLLPPPDGNIDAGDRAMLLGLYPFSDDELVVATENACGPTAVGANAAAGVSSAHVLGLGPAVRQAVKCEECP